MLFSFSWVEGSDQVIDLTMNAERVRSTFWYIQLGFCASHGQ